VKLMNFFFFSQNIKYNINGIDLKLPPRHRLPVYQSKFKRYDKFLPFIAKRLAAGDGVLDIGANCGDTIASLVSAGVDLQYYAVEPSDNYYKYLEINAETIKKSFPSVSINCIKCLVGSGGGTFSLIERDGTASVAKISDKEAQLKKAGATLTKTTLNDMINSFDTKFKLRLLKTDTDGSDSDVIDSGLEIIKKTHPLLFFECDPRDDASYLSYQSTFRNLSSLGYSKFFIFDNFGEYVTSVNEPSGLIDFMHYFFKQTQRRIYYIDIMAAVSADVPLVEAAIQEFNQTHF
jgi:FkbM family methyltransferase